MRFFTELAGEVFEDLMNGPHYKLSDAGPLHAPIVGLSVKRTKKLVIKLESVLEQAAATTTQNR
jgi:hypothetical protein